MEQRIADTVSLYGLDCGMGYTRIPLTPALSPGERENGPPPLDHTPAGVCPITIGKTPSRRLLFPLPEGEG